MGQTKILFVIDYYANPNAGTENQLFKLVANLERAQFEPHLLVFEPSEFLTQGRFPCPYSVVGSRSIKSPITWLKTLRAAMQLKRQGFKVAHVFFNDPSIICPPIFKILGFKTIISRRDMGYWYTPFYLRLLKFTRLFVDAVTVNSEAVKTITHESEHIPLKDIHVIYNGYEMVEDEIAVTAASNEVTQLSADNNIVIVLVANIRPIKRIEDMVNALAIINKQHNNVHFVQIGSGNDNALTELAQQHGLQEHCHFIGAKSNVAKYLAAADIGVLCSESEGFSNAIVEYQLAGLPVVCSNVGGNPEAVVHAETGYLYDYGDVETLAHHLQTLVAQSSLRKTMGKSAQQRAKNQYNIRHIVQQNEQLYNRLLT